MILPNQPVERMAVGGRRLQFRTCWAAAIAQFSRPQKDESHAKTPRRQDPKMNENARGKEVVDAAVKVHRELGFLPNFGSNLMKDGIECIVNGLEDE